MRTKQCLTAADVKKMLSACEAEAAKNKWAVSISIVDDGGFLLGALRMDGASAITAEVSVGKAKTSAILRGSSDFCFSRCFWPVTWADTCRAICTKMAATELKRVLPLMQC